MTILYKGGFPPAEVALEAIFGVRLRLRLRFVFQNSLYYVWVVDGRVHTIQRRIYTSPCVWCRKMVKLKQQQHSPMMSLYIYRYRLNLDTQVYSSGNRQIVWRRIDDDDGLWEASVSNEILEFVIFWGLLSFFRKEKKQTKPKKKNQAGR